MSLFPIIFLMISSLKGNLPDPFAGLHFSLSYCLGVISFPYKYCKMSCLNNCDKILQFIKVS